MLNIPIRATLGEACNGSTQPGESGTQELARRRTALLTRVTDRDSLALEAARAFGVLAILAPAVTDL